MRREWPLRFVCVEAGCLETANYVYQTKRDMLESFELKHGSHGRWKCSRHSRPEQVLSEANPTTRIEWVSEEHPSGRYFGSAGFVSGPGFRVWAKDFPAGTTLIVETRIVLPSPPQGEA